MASSRSAVPATRSFVEAYFVALVPLPSAETAIEALKARDVDKSDGQGFTTGNDDRRRLGFLIRTDRMEQNTRKHRCSMWTSAARCGSWNFERGNTLLKVVNLTFGGKLVKTGFQKSEFYS